MCSLKCVRVWAFPTYLARPFAFGSDSLYLSLSNSVVTHLVRYPKCSASREWRTACASLTCYNPLSLDLGSLSLHSAHDSSHKSLSPVFLFALFIMLPHTTNHRDHRVLPTPTVTGIHYPSNDDFSAELESYQQPRANGRGLYTHPNICGSTIDDVEPLADSRSIDLLWDTLRQEKEKKMAKERPKVQSLEEPTPDMQAAEHTPIQVPLLESPPISVPKSPRKHKSMYVPNFTFSAHGI